MRVITFCKDKYKDTTTTDEKPVLNIVRIVFNTEDNDWTHRLFTASLTLKATQYDKKRKLQSHEIPLVLDAYITPYHIQPVLEINMTENFKNDFTPPISNNKTHWTTTIEIENLELKENETLTISIIERKHIQERIKDWKKRINNLYKEINDWLGKQENYSCKIGRPTIMSEGLMQTFEISQQNIDTLDISHKGKIILTFKPKGLWTIAANGRIDILSAKGSFMLVDFAEQFQPPLWHIYASDKKTKNAFDRNVFQKVISFIAK